MTLELGSRTGGDGAADTVAAAASAAPDTLGVGAEGSSFTLGGIGPAVSATNVEPGRDRLTVNGLGGADTLLVSGSGAPDNLSTQAVGGLVRTELGGTTVDSDDFESLRLNTFGGPDTVTLGNLGGSDLGQITVDLSSPAAVGPGDAETDVVSVSGSDTADNIAVGGNSSGIAVSGLAVPASVVSTDPSDRLTVNGLAGADTINASGLAANSALLTLRGGPDADTLTGRPERRDLRLGPR